MWKWSSLRGAFSFGDIMFLSESGSGSRELTLFWLSASSGNFRLVWGKWVELGRGRGRAGGRSGEVSASGGLPTLTS